MRLGELGRTGDKNGVLVWLIEMRFACLLVLWT